MSRQSCFVQISAISSGLTLGLRWCYLECHSANGLLLTENISWLLAYCVGDHVRSGPTGNASVQLDWRWTIIVEQLLRLQRKYKSIILFGLSLSLFYTNIALHRTPLP